MLFDYSNIIITFGTSISLFDIFPILSRKIKRNLKKKWTNLLALIRSVTGTTQFSLSGNVRKCGIFSSGPV